jgi:hypothetical protein
MDDHIEGLRPPVLSYTEIGPVETGFAAGIP